jgi:hypothetical protein
VTPAEDARFARAVLSRVAGLGRVQRDGRVRGPAWQIDAHMAAWRAAAEELWDAPLSPGERARPSLVVVDGSGDLEAALREGMGAVRPGGHVLAPCPLGALADTLPAPWRQRWRPMAAFAMGSERWAGWWILGSRPASDSLRLIFL